MTWRIKLLLLLLAFAVIPAAVVAMLAIQTSAQTMRDSTLDYLAALARAKAEAIDQFAAVRRQDVERMASLVVPPFTALRSREVELGTDRQAPAPETLPELEDAEQLPAESPDSPIPLAAPPSAPAPDPGVAEALAELRQALSLLLWDQGVFEELLIFDPEGRVVASTFTGHEGTSAANLEYFQRGRMATFLQSVFRSPITGQLTMVISTPIRGKDGSEIGVFAARLNLKEFYLLINDSTGLGETGETVVGKKGPEGIVFMAPTRHDDTAALNRTLPMGEEAALPLQRAVSGQSGRGLTSDYRGKPVFAAWTHVPVLEWGLVTKVDHQEAVRAARGIRQRVILLTVVIVLLVVVASFVVARALVRPLGELREATDRISKGELDIQLDIRSRDEIGQLADSFERMVAAIKFFRERSLGRADPDPEDGDQEPESNA